MPHNRATLGAAHAQVRLGSVGSWALAPNVTRQVRFYWMAGSGISYVHGTRGEVWPIPRPAGSSGLVFTGKTYTVKLIN